MRATKKRADVLYNVLLKHFSVDEFLLYFTSDKKVVIFVRKNNFIRDLVDTQHRLVEFKWAMKHINTRCFKFPPNLNKGAISLEVFLSSLQESSWDFKYNHKGLLDIKHEFVKQILSTIRHWWICVRQAPMAPIHEYAYTVYAIDNLEQLVIEEELKANVP